MVLKVVLYAVGKTSSLVITEAQKLLLEDCHLPNQFFPPVHHNNKQIS
jgi:hypothetical protein